jgi:hypothetical protein
LATLLTVIPKQLHLIAFYTQIIIEPLDRRPGTTVLLSGNSIFRSEYTSRH